MKREAVIFAISGAFFGLLVGWVLGSQQRAERPLAQAMAPAAPAAPAQQAPARQPLDESRVQALQAAASGQPGDPAPREELGNLYFDAEQYEDAVRWYEETLELDPGNVNVSTDLGVSYYYLNQVDRALRQFDRSLEIDPGHTKTLLNMGIVRAFGSQDLAGAIEAWRRLVEVAPESPEGRAARQALESMAAAHPELGGAPAGGDRE